MYSIITVQNDSNIMFLYVYHGHTMQNGLISNAHTVEPPLSDPLGRVIIRSDNRNVK